MKKNFYWKAVFLLLFSLKAHAHAPSKLENFVPLDVENSVFSRFNHPALIITEKKNHKFPLFVMPSSPPSKGKLALMGILFVLALAVPQGIFEQYEKSFDKTKEKPLSFQIAKGLKIIIQMGSLYFFDQAKEEFRKIIALRKKRPSTHKTLRKV